MEEIPSDTSPRDYAQLEVGFDDYGIQVWCKRHETSVVHLDYDVPEHKCSNPDCTEH